MAYRLNTRKCAFSLVEVTIAIGIAAFAIISMLGLLGSLLNTNREAGDETLLAAMVKTTATDLRSRPFDQPAAVTDDKSLSALHSSTSGPLLLLFKQNGHLTGNPKEAFYSCRITLRPDASLTTPITLTENRYDAELEFNWPYPHQGFTQSFQISLARYAN